MFSEHKVLRAPWLSISERVKLSACAFKPGTTSQLDDEMQYARTLTQDARQMGLAGDFEQAHTMLDEAITLARGQDAELAHCAIERGRLYNSSGSPERSLPFFKTAWDLARKSSNHDLAVDAAHMMAIAAPVDDAIFWTQTALDYIAQYPNAAAWKGPLYNNLGWSYFEAGRLEEALVTFQKGIDIRARAGGPELRIAKYTVIRTLRALGRIPEAIIMGEDVVAAADATGDSAPFVYEELAECYAFTGAVEKSRSCAVRALADLSSNRSFAKDEPDRLTRLRVLAA